MFFSFADDDLPPTHVPLINSTELHQTSPHHSRYTQSPQTAPQNTLAQAYGTESSNFGPLYHHHTSLTHGGYGNPYDKYKVSPTHPRPPTTYSGAYQSYYGPSAHQMMRPNGYLEFVPR